eukprot:10955776-Alexandrium_andersonii.AAC.1
MSLGLKGVESGLRCLAFAGQDLGAPCRPRRPTTRAWVSQVLDRGHRDAKQHRFQVRKFEKEFNLAP